MKKLLKISEFAYLACVKRKNLIYYDEIGLISPEQVLENGYRYYSYSQLETISVIGALQELGMSLDEIKQHLNERSPAALIELLTVQRKNIEEKMQRLKRIETMIDTRLAVTRRALEIDPQYIELKDCPKELLFAGDEITDNPTKAEQDDAEVAFYNLCGREKITYGYPFGTMISKQNLLAGSRHLPLRFFYKIPNKVGSRHKIVKPAGLYLTACGLSSYEGSQGIYLRMFSYMKQNGLVVCGDAYEEFLLDEIATKDPNSYLLQVSIQVERVQ